MLLGCQGRSSAAHTNHWCDNNRWQLQAEAAGRFGIYKRSPLLILIHSTWKLHNHLDWLLLLAVSHHTATCMNMAETERNRTQK